MLREVFTGKVSVLEVNWSDYLPIDGLIAQLNLIPTAIAAGRWRTGRRSGGVRQLADAFWNWLMGPGGAIETAGAQPAR